MKKKLPLFVIHKHHAHALHYDVRLEEEGVLKSWAVPKGPSTDPLERRLALQVPDHELSYASFEGVIEQGYGAGPVLIWDTGTFENGRAPLSLTACIEQGTLLLIFHGQKIKGSYSLVKTNLAHGRGWLLHKTVDEYARSHYSITEEEPYSVVSGKTIEQLLPVK